MKSLPHAFSSRPLLLACLFLAICFNHTLAFQKADCNLDTIARLANGSISPVDNVFYRQHGVPMSDPSDIIFTLDGCRRTCGAGQSFYADIGPRLSTWLIPILLLLGNMHIAQLGPLKYL